jgi:hypothetical protein
VLDTIKGGSKKQHLNDKTIAALKAARLTKKPGPSIELGSAPKGKVLRTIKDYSGVNSAYGSDRTLVTKEGRCGMAAEPVSSLPDWFGPGYYDAPDKSITSHSERHTDTSYRLAFKSQGRQRVVHEEAAARRRELEQQTLLRAAADTADAMMFGDEAFEDYPSNSRSLTSSARNRPRYMTSSNCSHRHMELETSDMINGENAWSRSSARSTIGRPVSQSGTRSPQDILFSPSSSHTKEGLIFYDDVLNSEFMDSSSAMSHSSNHSTSSRANTASRSANDMLSAQSIDSLVLKGVKRDKAKFKMPDYTMGALESQESVALIIPEPIEVTQPEDKSSTSSANRFTTTAKYGEADPRKKFAITSTDCNKYNPELERDRERQSRRRRRNASKAAAVLEDIRSDLLTERSSVVLDAEIPFTESMDSYVDRWRDERNLVSTKLHRPKTPALRDLAPPVDFSQLLMDDSQMGLSVEEISQYTSEFSKELDFL